MTVTSWVSLAQSQPTCMGQPPWCGPVCLTGRRRGPVAACSLFGPRPGIFLKAVTGPRPIGGGGTHAGHHLARRRGRPPTGPGQDDPLSHRSLPGWCTSEPEGSGEPRGGGPANREGSGREGQGDPEGVPRSEGTRGGAPVDRAVPAVGGAAARGGA